MKAEVIVYGGTPAGVMAAVAAARQGHTVALVDIKRARRRHGERRARAPRTWATARRSAGWRMILHAHREVSTREKYGADSKELKACRNGATFEPHVAELIFEQMLEEQPGIKVWKKHRYRSVRSTRSQRRATASLAGRG